MKIDNFKHPINITLKIPKVLFNPGKYSLIVSVTDENKIQMLTYHKGVKPFKVNGPFIGVAPIQLTGDWIIDQ